MTTTRRVTVAIATTAVELGDGRDHEISACPKVRNVTGCTVSMVRA
jgi:hypothetical protein